MYVQNTQNNICSVSGTDQQMSTRGLGTEIISSAQVKILIKLSNPSPSLKHPVYCPKLSPQILTKLE